MTQYAFMVIYAYQKGYRVVDNQVISPNGNILFRQVRNDGYPIFSIKYNSKTYKVKIHQLSCFQKYGMYGLSHQSIRHIDGDKLNFREINIEFGTQQQNVLDSSNKMRMQYTHFIATAKGRKYYKELVEEVREMRKKGASYKDIMSTYPQIPNKSSVYCILNSSYITDPLVDYLNIRNK